MFKIDWYKLILYNVLSPLREWVRMQWLVLLLSQVRQHWQELTDYRTAKLYDVNHTGQVIYLEKALNDAFDNLQRRIYIEDGDFKNRIYIYPRGVEPLWLYYRFVENQGYFLGDKVLYTLNGELALWELTGDELTGDPPGTPNTWTKLESYYFLRDRMSYTYGIGFVVYVPITLQYDYNRMAAIINFRKVAGRPYKIEEI